MAKIFISSTSEDLSQHRDRLMETLRRLEQNEKAMEWFGAQPGAAVDICKGFVDKADLLVLIVAHRYGWVPSVAQGGDGESSITRIEVQHAVAAKKPVLAFVVDKDAEWTKPREQDRLKDAKTEQDALSVWKAVNALAHFKSEIDASWVRGMFTTPDDLADKVGTAVANWLLQRKEVERNDASAARRLLGLMSKVAEHVDQAEYETALTYLESAARSDDKNRPAIADKRLEIALKARLSLRDEHLWSAAEAVYTLDGERRAQALATLGKIKSQQARDLWQRGEREKAWQLAQAARADLQEATKLDGLDYDAFGSLGGLLKRMAAWGRAVHPEQTRDLEDAMLAAYEQGWKENSHAYPLLNYIEQRAVLNAQRDPASGGRELIAAGEKPLREALGRAVKQRERQLGNKLDRPWAAFDVARGRHYLDPNVPGFLEDLGDAVEEARTVSQRAEDRYMVETTCDSLRGLIQAGVRLEGLEEGLELLQSAVVRDDWYTMRPRRESHYLEAELLKLQAAMTDVTELQEQQLVLSAQQRAEATSFIRATELRWSREDEVEFQKDLEQWQRDLAPQELKIVRALWKVFGKKALNALTGVIPVDFDELGSLLGKLLKS